MNNTLFLFSIHFQKNQKKLPASLLTGSVCLFLGSPALYSGLCLYVRNEIKAQLLVSKLQIKIRAKITCIKLLAVFLTKKKSSSTTRKREPKKMLTIENKDKGDTISTPVHWHNLLMSKQKNKVWNKHWQNH